MPPQFSDYISQARDQLAAAYNAKQYPTGWFWNDDLNKQTLEYANTMYQNQFNAYQAELAFNRERQLINEQNAYNSPKNQLARYLEAGLNPSMIYGQVSPGLQTGVANYQPQKAASLNITMPGTTEKLNRAFNAISTIGQLFNSAASVASSIEGVKNQNLQNQILQARLPGEQMAGLFNSLYQTERYNWFDANKSSLDENGNHVFNKDLMNVLFPDVYRGAAANAKADYQNWWNEKIAPSYEKMLEGKSISAEEKAQIDEYNRQMLESLPPAVRPIAALFFQFLNSGLDAYGTFRKPK